MCRPTRTGPDQERREEDGAAKVICQLRDMVPDTMNTVTRFPTHWKHERLLGSDHIIVERLTSAPVCVRVKEASGIC